MGHTPRRSGSIRAAFHGVVESSVALCSPLHPSRLLLELIGGGVMESTVESFLTYPCTYDLLYVWLMFSEKENHGCSLKDLLTEMDSVMRHHGARRSPADAAEATAPQTQPQPRSRRLPAVAAAAIPPPVEWDHGPDLSAAAAVAARRGDSRPRPLRRTSSPPSQLRAAAPSPGRGPVLFVAAASRRPLLPPPPSVTGIAFRFTAPSSPSQPPPLRHGDRRESHGPVPSVAGIGRSVAGIAGSIQPLPDESTSNPSIASVAVGKLRFIKNNTALRLVYCLFFAKEPQY
ncbi:hypothetical protein QYE76_016433 [Lolium multiflorum]|uniref:Uncharacterized protein n=1 Tax=Lolium multiflorum TaxID=4521 RepID=A0AAD8QIK9_LOLMU|nr:hypothetical protein QYE76_016433 [Lolium multiflorum]